MSWVAGTFIYLDRVCVKRMTALFGKSSVYTNGCFLVAPNWSTRVQPAAGYTSMRVPDFHTTWRTRAKAHTAVGILPLHCSKE